MAIRSVGLSCILLAACNGPAAPTYWTAEATRVVDDLAFVTVDDRESGAPRRLFGIGYDTHGDGPWDGVAGENGCYRDPDGTAHGFLDIAREMNELALSAGANFAYVWSGRSQLDTVGGRLYGIWHDGYGVDPPPDRDVVPVVYNGAGESDMDADPDARAVELAADFAAFRDRTGPYAPETRPGLPPYADLPWFSWHPTWRIEGGGDGTGTGTGSGLTGTQADAFAAATTMMIADSYSYVVNRYDSVLNPLTGQKGERGEGYDLWLESDDPDHWRYFTAAWNMVGSAVTRSRARAADPAHPTVVWAWMQGHAFDDDIGRNSCFEGGSDLWAMGPFPTLAYLRKEITSTIVAGGTGIVFFGYMYCRFSEADKVRLFMRALSHPEVYEPALLSPRLDLGVDIGSVGDAGYDGRGRAHLMAKWHEATRTAYLIGANPGGRATRTGVDFPWSLERAEILDWGAPAAAPGETATPARFVSSADLEVRDRRLSYTVSPDEGFIVRLTPRFRPATP